MRAPAARTTLLAAALSAGALAACALAACADTATTAAPTADSSAARRAAAISYVVAPPPGKLPWPQHAPSFTRAQYDAMLRDLYIANNFALYQAAPGDPESMYLHDGVDIVLPNGTPIHAVEAGYVRYVDRRIESYKSVFVEDEDEPGSGWGYTHVDSFAVKEGDRVAQGAVLATVRFRGLEHLHLDRLHVPAEGGSWRNFFSLVHSHPDTFFVYDDTQPPRFQDGVHYFRNESDSAFARPAAGPPVVSGDVDVVVGLRDPGEHGHPGHGRWLDDRQAPARIEYAIAPLGGSAPRRPSFDFRLLRIPRLGYRKEHALAATVFKYYETIYPRNAPSHGQTRTSFYVITNVPEAGRAGVMTPGDGAPSWRTAERDAAGRPRYPNGDYVVTVWAYDFRGNAASRQDTVRVRN
jgi:hypothetical protein